MGGGVFRFRLMVTKTLLPSGWGQRLADPLGWCFLASLLVHGGLWYWLRGLRIDPLLEASLPPPIEVLWMEAPPAAPVRPSLSPPLGQSLPPPPPVGNLPPVANLPPVSPPPVFRQPPPTQRPSPPAVQPSPVALPSPVDTGVTSQETFDPTDTSTSDGLANLSRWIARLQPELTHSPQLVRLTAPLPTRGCPWTQAGSAVFGVVVNPQGQIEGTPELLRSSGYATLNRQARQLVTAHGFSDYAGETLQAVMVEVSWDNPCPSAP